MEVINVSEIKFDILNYIDLRGFEVKEILLTIIEEKEISEEKLLEKYLLDIEIIPKYFKNAIRLLLQVGLINEKKNKSYVPNVSFPELSFELNFFHNLSLLKGIYRITYDIYQELIARDVFIMKNTEFQPWCLENFGKIYTMTKNSANFWITLVSNLGFIQKLKFRNKISFLVLPEIEHYNNLLIYYQKQDKNDKFVSINDFGSFISKNFFNVFNKKKNLSISFQDWIRLLEINEKIEVRTFSDATSYQIKNKTITHFEIMSLG